MWFYADPAHHSAAPHTVAPHTAGESCDRAPSANESVGDALAVLLQPRFRRHLCKLAYADEWAQSIVESHAKNGAEDSGGSLRLHYVGGVQAVVDKHYTDAGVISKALTGVLAKELALPSKAHAADLLNVVVAEIADGNERNQGVLGGPWFT
jgi:hypothetical protein